MIYKFTEDLRELGGPTKYRVFKCMIEMVPAKPTCFKFDFIVDK